MNPRTIRAIDYWLGQPVCFFLTLLRYLSYVSAGKKETVSPKKILFLKFIEQGATVLTYPAIERAVYRVGKENVFFCVFESNRPILDILNVLPKENILSIRDKNFFSFLKDSLGTLLKIRRQKIDTIIDMEFFSRASAIFSYLSGAKIRVGLHRFTAELPYRGNLFTHRLHYNPYLHISVSYFLLVEATLKNPSDVPMMKVPQSNFSFSLPFYTPSEHEKKLMLKRISEACSHVSFMIGENKMIILNPNASDLLPLRKWDKKNFIELGKKILNENKNAFLILTGSPSEKKETEEICLQIHSERALSFAGKTTLRELLTLYSLSDMLITNDSGPGHFASLTGIKTIILFGPETPALYGPFSKNAKVIWKELACSPCVNVFNHRFSPCTNNVCMQEISADEVYMELKKMLAEKIIS